MTANKISNANSTDGKLRVLIVDDDRDQIEGLADLLEPRGHQIAVAYNIEETRRRLAEFDAQVALIDLRLGNESGIDLVRELRNSHPQLKCMLLTAYADLDSTIEAVKEGVFDFLRKPLSPASLFVSLDRCSQQIRLEREKTHAEAQLQHERDFSAQIINSLPGLFYVFDEQRFVEWNPKWEETTGYSSEELSKLYGPDFFEGADKKLIADRMQEVFLLGASNAEAEIVTKDGRKIPYFFTGARCIFEGVPHLVGLGIDITERKQIEAEREQLIAKLEAQNAELEQYAYTVSHDLKSPLITVKGFVGMMQQDLAKGDYTSVNDDLTRIAHAADKMDRLLRDLLELSRIGRLVNPSEEIPLLELTKEALELAHGQIAERGVEVEISPDLPVIYGDRLRLLEVMQNLIDNAVKYLGDQPRPRVEIGSRRDGNETVCFVRDNGIGIEPDYHGKIFGLFEQLDPHVEGSGIGLALVKRIIEIHGGRIWVESQGTGHGSTLCFTVTQRTA